MAVEDIDSLDSPHSSDTDCVPIARKSNIEKIEDIITHISSLRVACGLVVDETSPSSLSKESKKGMLLTVSQQNSFLRLRDESREKGFGRSMDRSMDESWKRIYDEPIMESRYLSRRVFDEREGEELAVEDS